MLACCVLSSLQSLQPFNMDLTNFSIEGLEQLLKALQEEIRKREAEDNEAELRKRRVFLEFQELAAKQGINLDKL